MSFLLIFQSTSWLAGGLLQCNTSYMQRTISSVKG